MTDKELIQVLYRDGYHAAAGRMEALFAENERLKAQTPQWVSVNERLPDENGRYLCIVKSSAFLGRTYINLLRYDKYGFYEGTIYTDVVTHWMPLPSTEEVE